MSKEKRKYLVIHHYIEDDFQSLGISVWIRKHLWWMIAWIAVMIIVGTLVDEHTLNNSAWRYIFAIPFVLIFIWGIWQAVRHGNKFSNKAKTMNEPIDLDELKKEIK